MNNHHMVRMRQGVGFISCHGLDVVDRENGEVIFGAANIMYLHHTFTCECNSLFLVVGIQL